MPTAFEDERSLKAFDSSGNVTGRRVKYEAVTRGGRGGGEAPAGFIAFISAATRGPTDTKCRLKSSARWGVREPGRSSVILAALNSFVGESR